MSFFGSKKTENDTVVESNITPDVLSQVRIMGEKSQAPTAPVAPVANTPAAAAPSTNPVTNPFLQNEPMVAQAPLPPVNQVPAPPVSPTPLVPPSGAITMKASEEGTHGHSSKILIIGSILTVGLILIIGIFLYLEKIRDAEIADQPKIEESVTAESDTKETATEPVLEKEAFSTTRSNYFSIDPETATKESILAEISDLEARMLTSGTTEPIVFQVTDQNNIPLAMSRFAYLMDFGPGEDILTALDEDFTLVLFIENGQVRRGIATKLKEEEENPTELLSKLETILPTTFRNILYPADLVLPTSIKFGTGSYNNSVVRYSNIAPEKGYSFDYILQNKLLFFGNSKDVTRKTLEVGVR